MADANPQMCDLTSFPKGVIFLIYKMFQTVSQIFPVNTSVRATVYHKNVGNLRNIWLSPNGIQDSTAS